jgi:hypothetical protein
MSNEAQEPAPSQNDNRQPESRRGAVIGLIVVMLLVVVGYFLMTALRHESQLEDCLMAGRRNCAPLDIPANKP